METMYNTRWRMAQSGGTFSCAHRRIQSQKELRLQSRKGSPKPLPPNFVCWLGTLVVGSGAGNPGIIGHSGATTCLQPWQLGLVTRTASSGGAADAYTGKADSYVPTFNGKQGDYREHRRRCDIYQMKMKLANREKETVFNHGDPSPRASLGLCGRPDGRRSSKV